MMHAAAVAGGPIAGMAGTATGVAYGAFKYNRMNYLYDQAQRFTRYTQGYSFAIEQTAQYREDIHDLTEYTVSKQDLFHCLGVIFVVITFQLIMAGRLGVHGPIMPGWLLGLHYGNACIACMYLIVSMWLALHASARAKAGAVHMLTRTVRLPIPTPQQLDKAREVGNSFEKARMTDMFRIPFIIPAPKEVVVPETEEDAQAGKSKGGPAKKPKATILASERRIPKWFQDEGQDLYSGKPGAGASALPEHFDLYRGLQEEWWAHDVYARIALLYFFSHWIQAAGLYSMSHAFGELRAIWVAWSTSIIFTAGHYCILQVDICSEPKGRSYHIPVEKIAPVITMISCLAMSFEYSIIEPSLGMKTIIYILAWTCYIIQLFWAVRLYDLAEPRAQPELEDLPGLAWWPKEWYLPPSFQHALYLVAAPKKLQPGQTCLTQEMKMSRGMAPTPSAAQQPRPSQPQLFPWKIFRGALFVMLSVWFLMTVGRIAEQLNGERYFLKQEGRMMRWPSHMQPWMSPWTRLGSRNEWSHTGGSDRRLQEEDELRLKVAETAERLIAVLANMPDALDASEALEKSLPTAVFQRSNVDWSALQEPHLLACNGQGIVAALTRARSGASVRLPASSTNVEAGGRSTPAEHFELRGIDGLGELLGTSWGRAGLLLITASGLLAECADAPIEGNWSCREVAKLPFASKRLSWGAAARQGDRRLRVAVVFEDEDGVALFDAEDGEWLPAGEVQLPFPSSSVASFSMSAEGGSILISTTDGRVRELALEDAMRPQPGHRSAAQEALGLEWRATCSLGDGQIAHLAAGYEGKAVLRPLLFTATLA
mmetsp:Transcript_47587/g.103453  ORF Transcript_47587/g.103453 Transcript_47587/m.103453 type:complete len:825 (-) Transcript_47587:57-2531(-)